MSGFCDCNGNGVLDAPNETGFDCEDLHYKSISCSEYCPKDKNGSKKAQEEPCDTVFTKPKHTKEPGSEVQLPDKPQKTHHDRSGGVTGEPKQLTCAPGEVAMLVRETKPGRVASIADVIESTTCAGSRSCKFPGVGPHDVCGLQDGQIHGSVGLYSIDTSPFFLDFTCFINHGCVRKLQDSPTASLGHEATDAPTQLEVSPHRDKPINQAQVHTDEKGKNERATTQEALAENGAERNKDEKGDMWRDENQDDHWEGTEEEPVFVNPWAKSKTDSPVKLEESASCLWRATAGCKKDGKRLPSQDLACGESIPADHEKTSGWCDCNGNSERDSWEMGYDCHSVERMPTCAAMCKYVTVAKSHGL